MSNKAPVFSIFEPHHFSDYGFDPQFDYFQVLEEARKHKREATKTKDLLNFKLQKPISKEDNKGGRKKRRWWWKNALVFFKSKLSSHHHHQQKRASQSNHHHHRGGIRSISGPIYVTESLSGSSTPCRTTIGPVSGPIAGSLTPSRKGDLELPYVSLRDMDVDYPHGIPAPPMPIYLVT